MIPGVLSLYIARRFTTMLLIILSSSALVIFITDYVEILRKYSDDEAFTGMRGVALAGLHVPVYLDMALPFTFLFAAQLSLLGLSRTSELVIARASGVSVWGFLAAPFVIAVLVGGAATGLLNPLSVGSGERANALEAVLSGHSSWGRGHWFRQEGSAGASIVYAGSAEQDGHILNGVTAYVFDQAGRLKEKVKAPRAEYNPSRWMLGDATAVSAASAPHAVGRYELSTDLTSAELKRTLVEPEAISFWALPDFIETAERSGIDPDKFRVAFQGLVSRPIFFLAMVMIAATVSLRLSRYGGTWRLILTGATIGFLLYAFSQIASDLGANGIINPVLAAWLPPIVALTFGATALLIQEDG